MTSDIGTLWDERVAPGFFKCPVFGPPFYFIWDLSRLHLCPPESDFAKVNKCGCLK